MTFQRYDNEEALSYISSFRLGSTTLQSSHSTMRIRDIHLWLDVTGTYLQHDVGRSSAHMRASLSRRRSMPKLQLGDLSSQVRV